MNINDLYITNYRESGGLPLHSITRLPKEEAYAFAKYYHKKAFQKGIDMAITLIHIIIKDCEQKNGYIIRLYL